MAWFARAASAASRRYWRCIGASKRRWRKLGFQRQPAQTPYEFAVATAGELAENIDLRRLAHLPRRVVEAFYRVRFGGHALDNQEADAVEHALVELELALKLPPLIHPGMRTVGAAALSTASFRG